MKSKLLVMLVMIMMSFTLFAQRSNIRRQAERTGVTIIPEATVKESGILTITGLEKFNGLFIQATASKGDRGQFLEAAPHYVDSEIYFEESGQPIKVMVGGKIENGSAKLPVWELVITATEHDAYGNETHTYDRVRYTGNDELEIAVYIWSDNETYHWHYQEWGDVATVKFDNGNAEVLLGGILTITGLEEFNELYIIASATVGNGRLIDAGAYITDEYMEETADRVKKLAGGFIENGSVRLRVREKVVVSTEYNREWAQNANTYVRVRYTGNDEATLEVAIWGDNETYRHQFARAFGEIKVKFTNGNAEGRFVRSAQH